MARSGAVRRGGAWRPGPARSGGPGAVWRGEVGDFAQSKIDITVDELKGERDAVKGLGLI